MINIEDLKSSGPRVRGYDAHMFPCGLLGIIIAYNDQNGYVTHSFDGALDDRRHLGTFCFRHQ